MIRDPEGIERQFLQNILGLSAGSVLEVGCGDGRLTEIISDVSSSIFALDPDRDSLDEARRLQGSRISLILGSGEHLPLVDNSVDTVIFSLSLHHHPDPGSALSQAHRVLREGGCILVLEPEAEGPTNRLFRLIHNEDESYDRAIAAIETSRLETIEQGCYETTWRFEGFDEMVRYLFQYFDKKPDREITDSMVQMLGDQRGSKPLDMIDITRYWLLQSRPDIGGGQAPQ
jgi:ubiquinone/menaquinone biosynthesis C-methylase UbiE